MLTLDPSHVFILREYLQRMPSMLSIFGMTLCLVIPKACPNMNPPMNFRQRKSINSSNSMKKRQSDRKYNIHSSSMGICLQSRRLGQLIISSDQDPTHPCMAAKPPLWKASRTLWGAANRYPQGGNPGGGYNPNHGG